MLHGAADTARAIAGMIVRGAPLIGVTGTYGMALAMREDSSDAGLAAAIAQEELALRFLNHRALWNCGREVS